MLFEMFSVTWRRLPDSVRFPVKYSSCFSCWAFFVAKWLWQPRKMLANWIIRISCLRPGWATFKHLKHCQFSMCSCIIRKWTFDVFFSFFFIFFLITFIFKPSADFFKGKTVFNHWLPGICYSNITFQLVSEATFNKSTLVEYSGVRHEPKQHRTGEENCCLPFAPSLCVCFSFCHGRRWIAVRGD